MTKQHQLGQRVLEILEAEPDWSSGTLDDISGAAFDLGLAETGEGGLFKAKAPATPVATPETLITYKAVRTTYYPASYTYAAKDGDGHRVKARKHDSFGDERQHLEVARKLIRMHWTNSPEVLDPTRYQLRGGWLEPGTYVWVVIDVREERR